MTKIHEINQLGQSIWYDYIQRSLMSSGKLQSLIDDGLTGMTSNPTIFDKAISGSNEYDADIKKLVEENKSAEEIYDVLSLEDIGNAADLLRRVYDKTDAKDGFVSIEVSPKLAYDTSGTIREAKRLFSTLNRPNVMIKVPATDQGLPAISELIGCGVNVNVTLIFSIDYYKKVFNAFQQGLEKLAQSGPSVTGGLSVNKIGSVASFFVSRVETYFDKALEKAGNKTLQGKIANANAKVAYDEFLNFKKSDRWKKLAMEGARPQRVLWASTSTKNPDYHKLLYVNELIGPETVNTVPPATFDLIKAEAEVAETLTRGIESSKSQLAQLKSLGIDYDQITFRLQTDGVKSFEDSFDSLMDSIRKKTEQLKKKVF